MADSVFGADFLTNPKMTTDTASKLETVDLPSFNFDSEVKFEPKIAPTLAETGPVRSSSGMENLNADHYLGSSSSNTYQMSDKRTLTEKYEMLNKFERMQRMGVPMRKRFTVDSPLDEMKVEMEFLKKERNKDKSIKQFCDWYVTGMSGLEWSSSHVPLVQAFGLKLDGLSSAAQMNVGEMEDDFEELVDEFGDKLVPPVWARIPIRIAMAIYMCHITNQMVAQSPVPNIDQILKTNPDIARQLATAHMQQQTQTMRHPAQQPAVQQNTMSSFMSGFLPPQGPPPQTVKMPTIKPMNKPKFAVPAPNIQRTVPAPNIQRTAPATEMEAPLNIDDLLARVQKEAETRKIEVSPPKSSMKKAGGSTGKNSVTIKL